MTTIQYAPDRWAFGGQDFSNYAYAVRKVTGADEFPKLRGEDPPFAGLPGRLSLGKLDDARRLALALYVFPMNAAGALVEPTAVRQARANLEALYAILGKGGQQALVRILPDASTRTAQAEVMAVDDFTDEVSGLVLGIVADFFLADPYFYGADVVDTSRAIPSSPTTFSLTNPGNVRTHRVQLDFLGPITNPRMTQSTTGIYVQFTGAVASTKHLIVDSEAFTALNDAANVIGSISHAGAFEFFRVEPGANALSVTGSGLSAATRLDTTFRPAYR
jgi:phage-related protein